MHCMQPAILVALAEDVHVKACKLSQLTHGRLISSLFDIAEMCPAVKV